MNAFTTWEINNLLFSTFVNFRQTQLTKLNILIERIGQRYVRHHIIPQLIFQHAGK